MGQGLSCASSSYDHDFFTAVQAGDLQAVDSYLKDDPSLLLRTTIYDRLSALHIAAANGRVEVSPFPSARASSGEDRSMLGFLVWCAICLQVLSMILDRSVSPDVLNRDKQVKRPEKDIVLSWITSFLLKNLFIFMEFGFRNQTPLMLAAMHGKIECVQKLLDSGANVSRATVFFSRFPFAVTLVSEILDFVLGLISRYLCG